MDCEEIIKIIFHLGSDKALLLSQSVKAAVNSFW